MPSPNSDQTRELTKADLVAALSGSIPHHKEWEFLQGLGVGRHITYSSDKMIDDWRWDLIRLEMMTEFQLKEVYKIVKRSWSTSPPYTT